MVLLVQGGGVYRDTRGTEARLGPGDLLLVSPELGHCYGPGEGQDWHEYYATFEGALFDALETCGVLDPARPLWRLGDPRPWRERFIRLFPPPGPGGSRPNAHEQLGGLTSFLLAAAEQCPTPVPAAGAPAWLAHATGLLAAPGEEAADLRKVSKACGLGYESFRKQFTALIGESPAAYRRQVLIARAQRLMRERNLPDRAIAAALGFCDEFHFSKTFKRVAGASPRVWRTRHLSG
jgi:AraC-like DNA-binding protein